MKEGLIKDTYESVIKEIQTIISVSYIIAVAIGMLFNYQKFSEFGINIFDYADVFDFLIAPFSDFKILFFTIISLAMVYLFLKIDLFWSKKNPKLYSKMNFGLDKKAWFNLFRYLSFTFLFLFYLYLSADIYGRVSRKNIESQPSIKVRYSDNEIENGKMIGKTKEIIFLLSNGEVKAIPITALVKEFEIK